MSKIEKVKQAVRAWVLTLVEVIGAERTIQYLTILIEELSG